MLEEPTSCAGNQGTTITIEDLFFNVPVRLKAYKPNDEYNKIFNVLSKYAVHNYRISFTLKKYEENNSIKTHRSKSPIDPIRVIFGNTIANSLMEVATENEGLNFKMNGLISKADYSGAKGQFFLFINHRLVECKPLKKAIFDDIYRTIFNRKCNPFVYVSIEVNPNCIDVNISPTKNEVCFLNEDLIVGAIKDAAEKVLLKTNETKKVYTQQLLPGAQITFEASTSRGDRLYPKDMVRTDPKEQSILKFFHNSDRESSQIISPPRKSRKRDYERTKLTSVKELLAEVQSNSDDGLREQIKILKFVGNVDRSKTLIQCDNFLLMCNNRKFAWHLFYQLSLKDFENFDAIEFEKPLKIEELSMIALELKESQWTEEDGSKEMLASQVEKILVEQKDMLKAYFQISINDKCELESIPMIVSGYVPLFAHLPIFILRLACDVNYDNEKECFKNISTEIANFYSKWSLSPSKDKDFNHIMQHIIFPKIRQSLVPPKKFLTDGTLLKLTSLQQLYKVFERC